MVGRDDDDDDSVWENIESRLGLLLCCALPDEVPVRRDVIHREDRLVRV